MNIIFAGTPQFAADHLKILLGSEHVIKCILTQPDRGSGRGKKIKLSPVKEIAINNDIETSSSAILYVESDGKFIGNHQGAYYFTKGQRKGIGVGGYEKPLFVIDTDVEKNIVYVGEGSDHPGLLRNRLFIDKSDEHWLRSDLSIKIGETMNVKARIRYRQSLQNAILIKTHQGLYVEFETPQSAITEGQFVAWYSNKELLGSGVIS